MSNKNRRILIKGFSIDDKACIDNAKNAIVSALEEEYLKMDHTQRLVAVLYAELKKKRGQQKFLKEFYVDGTDDINLVVRNLNSQKGINCQEKFVVVLFWEKFSATNIHLYKKS